MTRELTASAECPCCGWDVPHYHSPEEAERLLRLRAVREEFEVWFEKNVDRLHWVSRSAFNHSILPHLGDNPFRRSEDGSYNRMGRIIRPYAHPIVEICWLSYSREDVDTRQGGSPR